LSSLLKFSGELKSTHQKEKKNLDKLVQDIRDSSISNKTQPSTYGTDEPEDLSRYNSRLIDGEGIFIVHAGTILLHPFLKSLFSRLGLLNGNVPREAARAGGRGTGIHRDIVSDLVAAFEVEYGEDR